MNESFMAALWFVAFGLQGVYTLFKLRHELHMLQLAGYRPERFARWVRKNAAGVFRLKEVYPLWALLSWKSEVIAIAVFVVIQALLWMGRPFPGDKKPLVWTARVWRLAGVQVVLLLSGWAFAASADSHVLRLGFLAALQAGSVVITWLASVLLLPFEKWMHRRFIAGARRRLAENARLLRIGITGSYGKTSVKMFAATLFDEERGTLATPASFNTPMGICRTVNESLRATHEVFVAEMGARQAGDIRELCDLVRPHAGCITAMGEQHLETFGSQEILRRTKWELALALPSDGLLVANIGQPLIVKSLQEYPPACRVVTYGLGCAADYRAEDVAMSPQGSSFVVRGPHDVIEIRTPLVGRANVENLVAAIALARELGVSAASVRLGCNRLLAPPHRLELKAGPNGSVLIDDAYNSNPAGAAAALEVLAMLPGEKRFLVTPGMVELGDRECALNREFGQQAAAVCDRVFLVGEKQTTPIKQGLLDAGFPEANIVVSPSFKAAYERLLTEASPKDVVLFENDLPDNY